MDFNAAVLYRELVTHRAYTGCAQQVFRFVRPLRVAARQDRATLRFEPTPGQQGQVDFGQRLIWLAGTRTVAHVFVFTLGFSRRVFPRAHPHERLDAVFGGHERAFRHFDGVPEAIVVDNAKPVVLTHTVGPDADPTAGRRHDVVWPDLPRLRPVLRLPPVGALAVSPADQREGHCPDSTKGKTDPFA